MFLFVTQFLGQIMSINSRSSIFLHLCTDFCNTVYKKQRLQNETRKKLLQLRQFYTTIYKSMKYDVSLFKFSVSLSRTASVQSFAKNSFIVCIKASTQFLTCSSTVNVLPSAMEISKTNNSCATALQLTRRKV